MRSADTLCSILCEIEDHVRFEYEISCNCKLPKENISFTSHTTLEYATSSLGLGMTKIYRHCEKHDPLLHECQ